MRPAAHRCATTARSSGEMSIDRFCPGVRPQRQRRLGEDGCEDPLVGGHGEGEPAGEAHADGPHAGSTAALVLGGREVAQPRHDAGRCGAVASRVNSRLTQMLDAGPGHGRGGPSRPRGVGVGVVTDLAEEHRQDDRAGPRSRTRRAKSQHPRA